MNSDDIIIMSDDIQKKIQKIAEQVAVNYIAINVIKDRKDHSTIKHLPEFEDLGIKNPVDLRNHIERVLLDKNTISFRGIGKRELYYHEETNTFVSSNPNKDLDSKERDLGTCFRPADNILKFLEVYKREISDYRKNGKARRENDPYSNVTKTVKGGCGNQHLENISTDKMLKEKNFTKDEWVTELTRQPIYLEANKIKLQQTVDKYKNELEQSREKLKKFNKYKKYNKLKDKSETTKRKSNGAPQKIRNKDSVAFKNSEGKAHLPKENTATKNKTIKSTSPSQSKTGAEKDVEKREEVIFQECVKAKDGKDLIKRLEKRGYKLSLDSSNDHIVLVDYKARTIDLTKIIEEVNKQHDKNLFIDKKKLPSVEKVKVDCLKELVKKYEEIDRIDTKERKYINKRYDKKLETLINEKNMTDLEIGASKNQNNIERDAELKRVDRHTKEDQKRFDKGEEKKMISKGHGISLSI
jgi:hypothetical protein